MLKLDQAQLGSSQDHTPLPAPPSHQHYTAALRGKSTNKDRGQESIEGKGTHKAPEWAIIWVQVAQHLCIKEVYVRKNCQNSVRKIYDSLYFIYLFISSIEMPGVNNITEAGTTE